MSLEIFERKKKKLFSNVNKWVWQKDSFEVLL